MDSLVWIFEMSVGLREAAEWLECYITSWLDAQELLTSNCWSDLAGNSEAMH